MARKNNTPEEELLSLIEGDDNSDVFDARLKRRKQSSFFSIFNLKKHWLSFTIFFESFLAKIKKGFREPNIKVINKILITIAALLLIYIIFDFIFQRLDLKEVEKDLELTTPGVFFQEDEGKTRPFLYYLEMVQRRNVFAPVGLGKDKEEIEKAKETLSKMAKDLKLVGISWGQDPQAMIEDPKTKKVYFLKTGDDIDKFKVEEILKSKVILSYQGETIELR
ncbi:MAG: hypothetical protein K9L71_04145 [Candidatus Omnitrophica bacterium]|nr:hypothetical protein [Candidatus Omnitrophota bacterium]